MTTSAAPSLALVPAAYVFLRRDDRVLLQLRQNTGYLDGYWGAGAAGHVEWGETAAAAAVREAGEEVGLALDVEALRFAAVVQRTDGTTHPREQRADFFFTCDTWAGEPRIMEPRKCADLAWFALDALPERVPGHERLALEAIASGGTPALLAYGF